MASEDRNVMSVGFKQSLILWVVIWVTVVLPIAVVTPRVAAYLTQQQSGVIPVAPADPETFLEHNRLRSKTETQRQHIDLLLRENLSLFQENNELRRKLNMKPGSRTGAVQSLIGAMEDESKRTDATESKD